MRYDKTKYKLRNYNVWNMEWNFCIANLVQARWLFSKFFFFLNFVAKIQTCYKLGFDWFSSSLYLK